MIDTDKYENHDMIRVAKALLIEDAPLLLAEVIRLREIIGNREWTIKLCDEEIKRLRHELEIKKEALAKSQSSYKELRKHLKKVIE